MMDVGGYEGDGVKDGVMGGVGWLFNTFRCLG